MTTASTLTTTGTIRVPGLHAAVSITTDRLGIPHIRAGDEHDLFLAQGFTAARDRLWQIDLWRKRGLGRLAASFGPGFLPQDRAARLFLYRGDMAAEWAAYAPDAEAICTAFAAGINAFLALTEAEPGRLPPEFALTGTRPERWDPADVVRIRTHGLVRNAASELLRTIVTGLGADDALRKRPDPPVPDAATPDLRGLAPEALRVYRLATTPVSFDPRRLGATLPEAERWSEVSDAGEVVELEGSNNWAVSPARTATGRPILASDPHRAHAIPSLRSLVHLSAPGWDAIGYGEPSSPGICMGHNGTAAWGLTICPADQEDVHVYEVEGNRYRHGDGWEAMTEVEEVFDVRGAPARTHVLRFTRHGPVLAMGEGAAVAVRSVWSLPGTAGYLASLSGMRARSLPEFRAAMQRWGAPSCNQVYADTSGTVARLTCGFVPRRGWTGLLPVPGDGTHEWDGVRRSGEMPWQADPACGFVFSANENNLPAGWDHAAAPVGFEWAEPYRAERIRAVLAGDGAHTLAASRALQTDVFSAPALRLAALAPDGALRGWDGHLRVGSPEAALCELWWARHLRPALLALLVPDARTRAHVLPGDTGALLDALDRPGPAFGPDPVAVRDRMLRDTLLAAEAECARRMGPDRAAWRWGALHHARFTHALSAAAGHAGWDAGPVPVGGSAATPMAAGHRPSDFRLLAGASVRMVVDVGDWDRSVCINAPGQSGDPRSPHYADLLEPWSRGEYVPMPYTEAAVRAVAEDVLTLQPG